MTKIARKNQKIFADLGYTGKLGQFGSYAAGSPVYSNDPDTLQALDAFSAGLGSALINNAPPAIQDIDGLGYLITRQLAYLFQNGIPEWNAGATYYIGSLVSNGIGGIFISLTNDNTNHALSDTAEWRLLKSNKVTPITVAQESVYNVAYDDYFIIASGTSGTPAPYIFLPGASSLMAGRLVIVKSLIATAGELRVAAGNGTEYIDSSTYNSIAVQYTTRRYVCNGTDWSII